MFDRCLYFNTNHLARTVGKIWQEAFDEVGLAPAHAYLLRLVLQQPGIAQKEISDELHLEKSTITRFIDKMVDQGYLERRSIHSSNAKAQNIFPTNKAKNISNRLEEIGNSLFEKMGNAVGTSTRDQLVKNIKKTTTELL